jgi:hypothetical protein
MADRPTRFGFDDQYIDLTQPREVRYWIRRLRASAEQLSRAVQVVGHDPNEVERFLQTPEGRGYLTGR